MSTALGLIFSAMSALSSVVSAWVAVSTRRDQGRQETNRAPATKSRRRSKRASFRRAGSRVLPLVFVSLVSAAACVVFLASALNDGESVADAPLLRAVIPPAFSKTCEPEIAPEGAVATMHCRPSRQIVAARYTLYRGKGAMREPVESRAAELALPSGDCQNNGFARSRYGTEGEGNWGVLICYVDEDGARISWTNEDLRIVATALAAADKDDELYEWWHEEAGPLPTYNLKSFPSAAETRLLDWIPASQRRGCERSSWGGREAKASIVCSPPGVDTLGYASYGNFAEMRDAYENRLGKAPESSERSCTAEGNPGDGRYSIEAETMGRLLCYVSEGDGYYEWTYAHSAVAVYAKRDDGDLTRLYRWWVNSDFVE